MDFNVLYWSYIWKFFCEITISICYFQSVYTKMGLKMVLTKNGILSSKEFSSEEKHHTVYILGQ